MSKFQTELARALPSIRKRLGWIQSTLCQKTGISRPVVSKFEGAPEEMTRTFAIVVYTVIAAELLKRRKAMNSLDYSLWNEDGRRKDLLDGLNKNGLSKKILAPFIKETRFPLDYPEGDFARLDLCPEERNALFFYFLVKPTVKVPKDGTAADEWAQKRRNATPTVWLQAKMDAQKDTEKVFDIAQREIAPEKLKALFLCAYDYWEKETLEAMHLQSLDLLEFMAKMDR